MNFREKKNARLVIPQSLERETLIFINSTYQKCKTSA